ncbi:putative plasma membrane fusion protein prm1 [Cadophora sp. MPI-SDFR-AT-0126]|nr:putative plasma membrane fusion protein prm1 [Leotiomycetes sp. MPI-SDFR-AT-0126]
MLPLAGLRRFLASHTEMSSARNQPSQDFPTVPATLNAGDHELRDWPPNYSAPPNTTPYYTPYLGLRARLSQVWINRWTVLLILIICRLLLATKDLTHDITSAKSEALSACTSVEKVGSAMASMPHYLSEGVNALAADGVTSAVNGLMSMLLMSVSAVEEIVLFVIHMMTSTYLCLITLAVSGSLHVALDLIEKVGDFVNKTIGDITSGMTTEIGDFEKGFNSFLSDINIGGIFGSSKDPPKIDLTSSIDKLKSIKLDTNALDGDLAKLNASIPNFDQVQNFTDNVIRFPFQEVKKLMNESMVAYTFDKSVFPVAQKEALTFCSDSPAIDNFFDGLVKVVKKSKIIFLTVLSILAVAACIPMAYREIWRWRQMQQRSVMLQKNAFDPMDVIYIASRPYTTTAGIKLSSKFKSTKRQILARWFVAYATTLPALFVLALGLAGLFSCLCQYIVLKVVEKEVPALATEVGNFTGVVVLALNNASTAWSRSANEVIASTNKEINSDVFGWVNTTTSAVNGTLNTFTDEMGKALNTTFGGTILYDPIKEVLNCLIGLKIAGIQKGLTWVSDHAHVDFPLFKPDVFSLGAAASVASDSDSTDSFLSSPGSVASDDITGAVIKVSLKLQKAIKEEVFISLALIGVYVLIVLIGLGRVLFGFLGRDKTRAEGGPSFTGDGRASLSPRSPNRGDMSKFPAFGAPVSSIYPTRSNGDAWGVDEPHDEKMGAVGHRSVEASVKPGHERASSYGFLDGKH